LGRLELFEHEGKSSRVNLVETLVIKPGVTADTYTFENDAARDLAIVTVEPGSATPLQRVDAGDRTIEGHVCGAGTLTLYTTDARLRVYEFADWDLFETDVLVGESMQWRAGLTVPLVFYEICYPPYADGRFKDLEP